MNLRLEIVQFTHFLIDVFTVTYIFLFNQKYDIYFSIIILLQTLHWGFLNNECLLSYIEKKLIDPNYKIGEKPKWNPYSELYYNKFCVKIKEFFIITELLAIIYRNKSFNIKLICIITIILWLYYTYFHTTNFLK
jgi:hypothetical protein